MITASTAEAKLQLALMGHDTLTPATLIFRGNTFLGGGDDGLDTELATGAQHP